MGSFAQQALTIGVTKRYGYRPREGSGHLFKAALFSHEMLLGSAVVKNDGTFEIKFSRENDRFPSLNLSITWESEKTASLHNQSEPFGVN